MDGTEAQRGPTLGSLLGTATIREVNIMNIAVQSTQVQDVDRRRGRNAKIQLSGQRTCRSGEQIYDEEDPTILVYFVVTGMVRVYKLFNDGRRQITGFYVPGDMFGLEGAS